MLRYLSALFLTLCLCGPASAAQQEKREELFSLYSDICYHVESGDVLGLRVAILWLGPDEPFVFVQHGEGDMGQAFLVKLKRKGSQIEFTIMEDGRPSTFRGAISETEIVGRFPDRSIEPEDGRTLHRLKRTYARQMGFPECG